MNTQPPKPAQTDFGFLRAVPVVRKEKIRPVRYGSVTVPIYHTPSGPYDAYTVDAMVNGRRERYQRADLEDAREKALEVAQRIARGETDALKFTPAEVSACNRAVQNLLPTGKPIELATAEYADAYKILNGRSLVEAARYYAAQYRDVNITLTIPEAVEKMLEEKRKEVEQKELRPETLHDLTVRLGHFADSFQMPVSQLADSEIDVWLKQLTNRGSGSRKGGVLSKRSRYNYRLSVQNLINFLKREKYLPRDWERSKEKIKLRVGKITIFTPEQVQVMLIQAGKDFLPTIAIMAFAGVRNKETSLLRWEHVRFDSKYIVVNAESSKVAERRLVPILPNLLEMLLPYRDRHGRIYLGKKLGNHLTKFGPRCGFKWQNDALRHSFVSYRVAQTQNVAQVALESGNSVKKIFSNYRELVTPEEAERWFSVVTNLSQITPMKEVSL